MQHGPQLGSLSLREMGAYSLVMGPQQTEELDQLPGPLICTTVQEVSMGDTGLFTAPQALEDLKAGAGPRPLQPRLLKQINALNSKEELLEYVARCHQLLDPINLVTCLYRLARIYSITQVSVQKTAWRSDLFAHPSFTLLLSSIHSHLVQAQAILSTVAGEVPGLNARCMSNLIWAMVKLEVTADDGHPLSHDIVKAAAPLVVCFLPDCSGQPQGLANLLWSFAKIHTSPPSVLTAIVKRMVELLQEPVSAALLDVQALSNSIWAIAHVQSRGAEMDAQDAWQEAVASFLLLMASQCLVLLHTVIEKPMLLRRTLLSGMEMDGKVSCQAVANIAWSFATILGSACGVQDPVRPLFLLIRQLTIAKLGSNMVLSSKPSWSQTLAGTFNEQALANMVFAYDKAGMLDGELLQCLLDAACQKLARASAGAASGQAQPHGALGFKPQELCVLLEACQHGSVQPWAFLQTLNRVLSQYPLAAVGWTQAEQAQLRRALSPLATRMPEQVPHLVSSNSSSRAQQVMAVNSATKQQAAASQLALPSLASSSSTATAHMYADGMELNTAFSAPSQQQLRVPVQQVWVRSPDGSLQACTLLLAGSNSSGQQQYTVVPRQQEAQVSALNHVPALQQQYIYQ